MPYFTLLLLLLLFLPLLFLLGNCAQIILDLVRLLDGVLEFCPRKEK
jgi:hypothetical protein